MLRLRSTSPDATRDVAAAVARLARSGDVVVLAGEMGAGKTAFAQGFGAALGVTEPITSPTFNLVHSHSAGKLMLHHADVYRLGTNHEVADLAFAELAEADGVLLVEWGDVIAASLGEHLIVHLRMPDTGDTSAAASDTGDADTGDEAAEMTRVIEISPIGRVWATRWAYLTSDLERFAC